MVSGPEGRKTASPELAEGLVKIRTDAHKTNKKFQAAFDGFFTFCQQTFNPNISRPAVDGLRVELALVETMPSSPPDFLGSQTQPSIIL